MDRWWLHDQNPNYWWQEQERRRIMRKRSTPHGTSASGSSSTNTTPDGKQVILMMGDSIQITSDGSAPTPTPGALFQWTGSDVVPVTTDLTGANTSTLAPQCANDYYAATGLKLIFINRCSGGSAYSPRTGLGENWSTTGSLYAPAIADCDACLAALGLTEPVAIFWNCGVNDANDSEPLATIQADVISFFQRITTKYPNTPVLIGQVAAHSVLTFANDNARLGSMRLYQKTAVETHPTVCFNAHLPSFHGPGYFTSGTAHLTATGLNEFGKMRARWLINSGYSKAARSVISSHFDDLSTTQKDGIEVFCSTELYQNMDYYARGKTTTKNNVYFDWAFSSIMVNAGFGFTANDSISTNPTGPLYLATGYRPAFVGKYVSLTNYFQFCKVKTNNTAAGTAASSFGGSTVVTEQTTGSAINYRCHSGTNSTYSTDTKIANNTMYGVGRTGGTQFLRKNGSQVHSGSTATNNIATVDQYVGARNSGTPSFVMDGSFEYFGICSAAIDLAKAYTDLEALNSAFT